LTSLVALDENYFEDGKVNLNDGES
jgi:hypothetical protein